jgi:hypothetical protein
MPPANEPGQPVKTAGTYHVTHYKHREDDTYMVFRIGQVFPHCRACDDLLEYDFVPGALMPAGLESSRHIGLLPK